MAEKMIVSRGESFEVVTLDRAYTGKETTVFRVSGGNAANPVTGAAAETLGDITLTGNVKLGGSPVLAGQPLMYTLFTGVAAAGPITLTGAKVGDKVAGVIDVTNGANQAAKFESVISVLNQLQQTSATNESAVKFTIIVVHQS